MDRVRGDKHLLRTWWNRFMGDYLPQEEFRIFKRDMLLACNQQSSPLWFSQPAAQPDPAATESTDPSVQGPPSSWHSPPGSAYQEAPTREEQCDQLMFLLREMKRLGHKSRMADNQREVLSRLWHTFVQTLSGDNSVLESWYGRLNEGTIPESEFRLLMGQIKQICDGHNQEWFGQPGPSAAMPPLAPGPAPAPAPVQMQRPAAQCISAGSIHFLF